MVLSCDPLFCKVFRRVAGPLSLTIAVGLSYSENGDLSFSVATNAVIDGNLQKMEFLIYSLPSASSCSCQM